MKKLLIPFVAVSMFFACQKNDALEPTTPTTDYSSEYNASTDVSTEVAAVQNVNQMVQEVMDSYAPNGRMDAEASNASAYTYVPTCAVITPDAKNKSITINFGTGCTTPLGGTYSGSVKITYTGKFGTSGSTIKVDLTSFATSRYTFNGSMTLSNFKLTTTALSYDVALSDLSITDKSGKTTKLNMTLSVNWAKGINTPKDPSDDIFSISITGSFTDNSGKSYTIKTTDPMILKAECSIKIIPVSGTLEMTPSSGAVITVDFGAGTCDDIITVTVKGVKKEVDLIP